MIWFFVVPPKNIAMSPVELSRGNVMVDCIAAGLLDILQRFDQKSAIGQNAAIRKI